MPISFCVNFSSSYTSIRSIEDVENFVESLGNTCSSNSLTFRYVNSVWVCKANVTDYIILHFRYLENDNSVRVCVLSFLVEMASISDSRHQHESSDGFLEGFHPNFVEGVIQKVN